MCLTEQRRILSIPFKINHWTVNEKNGAFNHEIMKKLFKNILEKSLQLLGLRLIKTRNLARINNYKPKADEFQLILQYPPERASNYMSYRSLSKAQIKQDLFVLMELNFKKKGFFVEFGATDGVSSSNTYLLEREFEWLGILAEPARCWHENLIKNRSSPIEKKCIWSQSGEKLIFNEVEGASLSTIEGFGENDYHRKSRQAAIQYEVQTLSLIDLLDKYNAPAVVDYLSIDTEGSEFVILENFDFSRYKFRVITVEHNYTAMREQIFNLLRSNGYSRVHQEYSLYDDWYIWNN